MKKNSMRLLGFLLVAVMMVSLLGLGVFAGDTANDVNETASQPSETLTWKDGDVIDGNSITISKDVTINVSGTVTVNGTIRLAPDAICNVVFNGSENAKLIRGEGFTGQMFYAEGTSDNFQKLTFNNITLDGGAVWTGDVDKTLNRGTTNAGVKATGSVLYLVYANATLENGSVLQNHDDSTGEKANAVFLRYYSTFTVNDSVVRNNHSISTYYRGGVVTIRQGGTVKTNNADVYGNSGAAGGFVGISSTGSYGGIVEVKDSKFHNNYADNGAVFLMQCNSKIGYLSIEGCEFYENASKTAVLTEWAYSRPFIIKDSYFHDNECAVWDCHADPVLDLSGKIVVEEDADYTKYLFETPLVLGGALTDGSSIAISEASLAKLLNTKAYVVTGTADYAITDTDLAKFVLPEGYKFLVADVNFDGIMDAVPVDVDFVVSQVTVTLKDSLDADASETRTVIAGLAYDYGTSSAHTGFAFTNWQKDDGKAVNAPIAVTSDSILILTAQWKLANPSVAVSVNGATLTATISNANEDIAYTYQWYIDGTAIDGATADTYTMTDLASHNYRCTVTASYEGYKSTSGNSREVTASVPAAAQIGDVKYGTLEDAVAAAQENDEIKILVAGTYAVPTGKNITVTGAVDGVKFDMSKAVGVNASMTFNNVTFEYGNANYVGLQHAGTMVYNNCTINGQVTLYGASETFNNCTFNQNSADAYNVWTYGGKEVAFNECTFNSVGKSVLIYSDQASQTNDVSFTACTLNASAPADGKAAIEMDSSIQGYINLTIDADTTVEGFGIGNVSGNSLWNNKKNNLVEANNDITVVVDGVTVLKPLPLVAELNGVKYTSLQGALDLAKSSETITLLADVTGNVTVKTSVTIDGAEFKYTGTMTVNAGLTITVQNVNFVNGGIDKSAKSTTGTYTIKDCTFDGSENTYNYSLRFRGANKIIIENCSVKNYRYSFLYVTSSTNSVSVKNVTVENCPDYAVYFSSGFKATFENLTVKNSNRGFLINNTANRAFTIKDCKMENVVTAIAEANGTNTITCTVIGNNDFGGAVTSQYAKYVLSAKDVLPAEYPTLTAPEGATVTTNVENHMVVYVNGTYVVRKYVTIDSIDDLLAFGAAVSGNTLYKDVDVAANPDIVILLTADLDLANSGFAPIGNGSANAFSGIFDGQGHTISNMTLTCDYYRGVGFFRSLGQGAIIKNLTFVNADVNNGAAAGANHFYGVVAGFSNNVILDNVDIRDSKVTCKYAGSAMIGCLEGASTIKNCDIENVILNTTSIRGAVYGILGNSAYGHTAALENNTIDNVVFIVDGEIKAVQETLKYNEWADGTEYTESMYVAQLGDTKYTSLADAIAAANDGDTVTLIGNVVRASSLIVDKNVTIDFNGYTVYGSEYIKTAPVLRILADVTVKGGAIDATAGESSYAFIVGNSTTAGSLTIVDGKYYGDVSAVSVTKGTLTIEDGYFEGTEYEGAHEFTLNCIDANYKDGSAKIIVKGGTFYKFNPENNASEGVGTDYVPAEYMATADGDNYVVTEWNYEIWTKADLERLATIVNGGNTLKGVTVKLMADIDLYELDENGERVTFTPIGNHSDGGVFKGTFDGQDHTISNLYQNGWALGYEWGVYGSAGLFGEIEDATVKNLTLTGAEILVEGGDVGGITGSATGTCVFENITITDSAFATFNNGCASIIAWSGAGNYTFRNITIASDVTVAGLWGSFDSSLGGVVGQAEPGATYNFEDVYVACRIDAYNDCTASYDYYNYRMSGMIMGRLEKTTTIDGRNYPDTSKYNITCTNVTVEYGYWMDYHYCDPTPSNMNGGRGMRVEAGYAYDGLPADYDHSQCTINHMNLIPFDQLFGGDQYGVDGLPTYEGVTVIYPFYAAQIDGVKYKTLSEAIAAVQNGETITLLADIDEDVTIKQQKGLSFTIDGADKIYTGTMTINGGANRSETLTIQNVNFVQDTAGQIFIEAVSGTYAHNITVDDCTFTGTDKTAYGMKVPNSYNIVIKNSTGTGLLELGYSNKVVTGFMAEDVTVTDSVNGFYMSYVINASFKDAKIEATNVGIYVNNYNSSTATIEDCTITAANPVVIQERKTTNTYKLVFKGTNTFTAGEGNSWLTVDGQGAKVTVDLTGATYLDINEVTFEENYYGIFKTETENVYDIDKRANGVAAIGNYVYATLADAFAAAVDGDVITLLKDVTLSETVLTKTEGAITLDLGGYTITTENEINPAIRVLTDLTVKNGTMDTEAYCFIVGGTVDDAVVAGNLTIVDGTYHGGTSVASVTKGTLTVLGGDFSVEPYEGSYDYTLNCIDANYKDGTASIVVKGGTFYKFNPENNASEGVGTNYVPVEYMATADGDNYVVTEWNYEIWDWDDLKKLDAIVEGGNMLEGVTVKLMDDINLYEMGDGEPVTFNPIGANQSYFKGTFDGQGHTIKNMYQSGWALGYDWYNYGSIGLFAYLWDATVKNLTIENAECFVEGGSVAAIAGCAWGDCTFENITVRNSTFATYNNRAAGIVGYTGGNGTFTFKDITVDENTVIAGLWGSFDSSMGGIMGQLQSDSKVVFENVRVACRIDAYNDVTASYKYYAYRMCGMLIGRVPVDANNKPILDNVTFVRDKNGDETTYVNFGEWAHYLYIQNNVNGYGWQRVQPGYTYGGADIDLYPDANIILLPFTSLFGGQQYGSYGQAEHEDVIVNYPYEAAINGTNYWTLADAFAAAKDGDTIVVLRDLTVYDELVVSLGENETAKSVTLDLNGKTLTAERVMPVIRVQDGNTVTVTGNGAIVNATGYVFILGASDGSSAGNLTIENGTFEGQTSVASVTKGELTIKGGEFKTAEGKYGATYLLNCIDANYKDGSAKITVMGGTFYGFDPEHNAAEGADTDFVANTHMSNDNGNDSYTVINYIEWIKEQLLLGNDVVLEKDIVVDGTMVESIPASTNGNGKYYNPGIFNVVGDYDVTFDLNGHTITYVGHEYAPYTATYNKDYYYNEESGKHEVLSCTVAHGLFFANAGADLTVTDSIGTGAVTIYGLASGAFVASPDTSITITGGTWKNEGCATCGGTNIFLYPLQGGELYIEGGYFEQALDANGESYLLVLHGGEYANSVIDYAKTKLVVSGGTFVGMNPNQARYFYQGADNKTDMSQTTNVVALGYAVEDKGNGVWTIVDAVAHINGIGYATLADAIAAVKNGETIVLLADIDEDVTIIQKADLSFTIDGADKTYTGTININGNRRSAGAETLTIKNVNFLAEGQWQSSIFAVKNTYVHNLIVDGCTFTGTDAKQAYGIRLHHSYNIVVKNTTGTKLYDLVYGNTAVTGFTAENVTVTDSGMGFMLPYGMDLSFKNVTIEAEGAGVAIYNYGENNRIATFENCTITANPPIFYEEKGTLDYTLVFKGENKFVNSSETEDHWLNVKKLLASEKLTIDLSQSINLTVDGISYDTVNYAVNEIGEKVYNFKYIPDVAQIGDVKYKTLAAAIAAVKNGETIVLLADIDEDVTIKQQKDLSFTIDGADKTYTGTMTINGNNRATGAETLTVKNVNFVATELYQKSIATPNKSYAHNVTIDNCTFTATGDAENTAYAIHLRHVYNFKITNTTGSKLLDLVYGQNAVTGITVENVTVTDSTTGIFLAYVNGTTIFKNVTMSNVRDGIGFKNNVNGATITIEDCTLTANRPVGIEEIHATNTTKFVFKGTNTFTAGEGNSWLTVVGQGAMVTVDLTGATYLDINEVTFDENYYSIFKTKTENVYDIDARTNAVAAIGDSLYKTLQAALDDAKNGETIILLKDLVYGEDDIVVAIGGATGYGDFYNPAINYVGGTRVDGVNSPSDINAVLDLNGYTITNNADAYLFLFMDNCKITIKDSKDGDGMISNTEYPLIWVTGTETLVTIENGKYNTVSTSGLIHVTHGGDLVINGGEFRTSADDASSLIIRNDQDRQNSKYFIAGKATVTVYGGTFYGFDPENTPDDYANSAPFFNAVAEGYMSYEIESNVWVVIPADSVVMLKTEGSDEVKFFNSIAAAMAEARATQATDTVYLMKDHEESIVIIYDGTTLNLQSYTLKADYVVGFNGGYLTGNTYKLDSDNYGRLVVDKNNVILGKDAFSNGKANVIPVWDKDQSGENVNGAYVFSQVLLYTTPTTKNPDRGVAYDSATNTFNAQFKVQMSSSLMNLNEGIMVTDTYADHGVSIIVRSSWTDAEGVKVQDYHYNDEIVQRCSVYDSSVMNYDFTFSINVGDRQNFTLTILVVTDAGTVVSSATYPATP